MPHGQTPCTVPRRRTVWLCSARTVICDARLASARYGHTADEGSRPAFRADASDLVSLASVGHGVDDRLPLHRVEIRAEQLLADDESHGPQRPGAVLTSRHGPGVVFDVRMFDGPLPDTLGVDLHDLSGGEATRAPLRRSLHAEFSQHLSGIDTLAGFHVPANDLPRVTSEEPIAEPAIPAPDHRLPQFWPTHVDFALPRSRDD